MTEPQNAPQSPPDIQDLVEVAFTGTISLEGRDRTRSFTTTIRAWVDPSDPELGADATYSMSGMPEENAVAWWFAERAGIALAAALEQGRR